MFCSAIENPKVAAEIPRSSVIGRMNSPRLWRRPMHSEMISPLRTISTSIARRLLIGTLYAGNSLGGRNGNHSSRALGPSWRVRLDAGRQAPGGDDLHGRGNAR